MSTIDGGCNPSWTGFMCLLSAAVAGWSLRDVEHAARTAPGMEHYRTKNTGRGSRRKRDLREAQARLERQWEKARQYAALYQSLPQEREPQDFTELIGVVDSVGDILHRLQATPGRWSSEAGQSRRSILQALAYLTLQTGKRVVSASIRDLALATGLGRTTAATALHFLERNRFIQRISAADQGNAAEWQLTPPLSTGLGEVRSQQLNNPRPPAGLFDKRVELVMQLERGLLDARHDLFTRAGLGHRAGTLFARLGQEVSVTVDSAAKLLGVSPRHTTTILSRLRHHRLIIRQGKGWARSKRDFRDHAARAIGVAGYLQGRAERYEAERQTWAWWRAELETMNSSPTARPRRPHVTSRPLFRDAPGERIWPRYPRRADARADHKSARQLVLEGALSPESRFQYLGAA